MLWFAIFAVSTCGNGDRKNKEAYDDSVNFERFKDNVTSTLDETQVLIKDGKLSAAKQNLINIDIPSFSRFDDNSYDDKVASYLDPTFSMLVEAYINKGDYESAKNIGKIFDGKLKGGYSYTITYNLLENNDKSDNTSHNSQESNIEEDVETVNENQTTMQTEEDGYQNQNNEENYSY